jgi:hypothetical protein
MQASGRFVLVECLGAHAAKSTIILPQDAGVEPNLLGRIHSVGVDIIAADARLKKNGDLPPDYSEYKKGDIIIYNRSGTREIKSLAYIAVEYASILGKWVPEEDDARAEAVKDLRVDTRFTQAGESLTRSAVSAEIGETQHHKLELLK